MRRTTAFLGSTLLTITAIGGITQLASGANSSDETVYIPVTPCRLIDTRPAFNVGPRSTPLPADTDITFGAHDGNDDDSTCTIPNTATAINTNVTVVGPTAASFLTIFPAKATRPSASSLNYTAGAPPTPNAVTIPLSNNGEFSAYNRFGTVDVIVDISGYYQPTTNIGTTGPQGPTGTQGPTGPAGQIGPIQPQISTTQIAQLQWWPGARTDYPTGVAPIDIVFDGTNIWITNFFDNTVSKIDPTTGLTTDVYDTFFGPWGIAFDGTSIWITHKGLPPTVTRMNPADGTQETFDLGGANPDGVAFDGTNIWVANRDADNVSKIDPADGTRDDYETGNGPQRVAFDGTNIWITNFLDNTVSKMNPDTGERTDYQTGERPLGVAFDGTNIWIANNRDDTVSKMNPDTGERTDYPTGTNPDDVLFDGTNIWISNNVSDTVSKMNPDTGQRTDYPTRGTALSLAFDGTNIWIITNFSDGVSKMNAVAETDGTTRWAKIDADNNGATIINSAGATATSRDGTGVYIVEFDAPVNNCAWTATLNDNTSGVASNGQISVEQHLDTLIENLIVRTYSETGNPEDPAGSDGFSVVVNC